jgi:type VI secretion system protein ImpC
MPECAYLALTVPRFMLRAPYGAKSEPIDSFKFEEFNDKVGLRAFLWGNSAVLAAVLIAETYNRQGDRMKLGKIMSLGDMPYHFYTDSDGDQIALPSTERLLSERSSAHVSGQRFAPVLSIKGRPEVRLGSFQSIAGGALLGRWAPDIARDGIAGAIAAKAAAEAKAEAGAEAPPEAAPVPVAAERPVPAPVPVAAEPKSEPEETEAPPATADAADDDDGEDLDALLAGLEDDDGDAPAEAAAGSGADDDTDLDSLLAGLDDDDAGDGDGDAGEDDELDDLDALLAELGGDDEEDDDEEMDPDLAALLDSL